MTHPFKLIKNPLLKRAESIIPGYFPDLSDPSVKLIESPRELTLEQLRDMAYSTFELAQKKDNPFEWKEIDKDGRLWLSPTRIFGLGYLEIISNAIAIQHDICFGPNIYGGNLQLSDVSICFNLQIFSSHIYHNFRPNRLLQAGFQDRTGISPVADAFAMSDRNYYHLDVDEKFNWVATTPSENPPGLEDLLLDQAKHNDLVRLLEYLFQGGEKEEREEEMAPKRPIDVEKHSQELKGEKSIKEFILDYRTKKIRPLFKEFYPFSNEAFDKVIAEAYAQHQMYLHYGSLMVADLLENIGIESTDENTERVGFISSPALPWPKYPDTDDKIKEHLARFRRE